MLRKISFLCFLIISSISFLSAQEKTILSIIDKTTQEPLKSAHIEFNKLKKHFVSDENGKASFVLDSGKTEIKITYIGYKDTSFWLSKPISALAHTIELTPLNVRMKEVFVTASRKPEQIDKIAASTELITSEEIKNQPVSTIDNVLQTIANVYVNRSWGIFSKNASVTMRGLDGKDRVLVLLDGVPLNKAGGGSINWNLINPDRVERIEVIKGPNSAIYGNNAMNGVINLITKKPDDKTEVLTKLFAASYHTYGGSFALSKRKKLENKSIYWSADAFYRKGDGYFFQAEAERDSTAAKLNLEEYNAHLQLGIDFKNLSNLQINYSLQHDLRGSGTRVYTPDGSFDSYTTHLLSSSFSGKLKKTDYNLHAFAQRENYLQQSESVSANSGNYKLSESPQISLDYGMMTSFSRNINETHDLTYGFDFKESSLDAKDIYRTASDYIERKGSLSFAGIYFQDNWQLTSKYIAGLGVRADFARFHSGSITATDPTSNTGFTDDYYEAYPQAHWFALSPKLSLKNTVNSKFNHYISVAKGFRPPTIDDMCSTRKINKGFKIANPNLKPEELISFEYGFSLIPVKNMKLQAAVYYTLGSDFQYFVGTGDSIDTGGGSLKPIVKRENISKVTVKGFELNFSYSVKENLIFKANYAYNKAEIKEFDLDHFIAENLEGKQIIETPSHQAFASLTFTSRFVNTSLVYNYIGKQWLDDGNTLFTEDYSLLDLSFAKAIKEKIRISFDIQNLANLKYVDKKGYESPGRFLIFGVAYSW